MVLGSRAQRPPLLKGRGQREGGSTGGNPLTPHIRWDPLPTWGEGSLADPVLPGNRGTRKRRRTRRSGRSDQGPRTKDQGPKRMRHFLTFILIVGCFAA